MLKLADLCVPHFESYFGECGKARPAQAAADVENEKGRAVSL
jgi:hypothetical protein